MSSKIALFEHKNEEGKLFLILKSDSPLYFNGQDQLLFGPFDNKKEVEAAANELKRLVEKHLAHKSK